MNKNEDLFDLATEVLSTLRATGHTVATAESCTGGLIAGALTEVPGSSDVVDRGYVTYSNHAKSEMLGVPSALIDAHGAVSEPVARAMAEGALSRSGASHAVAVTGVAGPGQSERKPAGLVYVAWATKAEDTVVRECRFKGDRYSVRLQTVFQALKGFLRDQPPA